MGCAASKATGFVQDLDSVTLKEKAGRPEFELSTAMLVMPFHHFKAQKRIFKSVKSWRDPALADGRLVEYAKVEGGTGTVLADDTFHGTIVVVDPDMVVLFITHTWWDREYLDPDRDESDEYDKGAPDYQTGDKKDRKWQIICKGVEALIEEHGLDAAKVALWCDWQVRLACVISPDPASSSRRHATLTAAILCSTGSLPCHPYSRHPLFHRIPPCLGSFCLGAPSGCSPSTRTTRR